MRIFKEKSCRQCEQLYLPTGSSSFFCSLGCRAEHYKQSGKAKGWRDTFNRKAGKAVGVGSGGLTKVWKDNPAYTKGRHAFIAHGRRLKNSGVPCNRCGKDLRDATRGEWCSHHIDHNRSNNTPENLELLCKRCHQAHHHSD